MNEKQLLEMIAQKVVSIDERVQNMGSNINKMENDINTIKKNQDQLESKLNIGFESINQKLDTIYSQVAINTEQEVRLNDLANKVNDHDTDIKLIKQIISNQLRD